MKLNKSVMVLVLALLGIVSSSAQIPEKPNPPRLVNDLAGIFTPQQVVELEDSLARFSKNGSVAVCL